MLEHGAYTLLLDACYDRERFPTMDEALEWTWARSDEEIRAVQFVLSKFFDLVDGVYVQGRVQDEIEAYQGKALKNKEIALAREEARRTKRAQVEHEPCTDRHLTINHKPLTNNQEQLEDQKLLSPASDGQPKITYSMIQDAYNEICSPTFPACAVMNDKRKRQIKAMGNIQFMGNKPFASGIQVWRQYFEDCLTNPHWRGENDRGWKADFDFVTNTRNAIKLMERMS